MRIYQEIFCSLLTISVVFYFETYLKYNDGNNRNMRQTMCYVLKGTKLSYADDFLVICNPYRAFHTDLFQDHVLRTTTSSHNLHLYFLFETNKSLKNEFQVQQIVVHIF